MSEQIKCGISIPWDVIQPQQGMTRAAVGTNLASITLSERSPSQKAIFYDPTYMKFSEEANQRQKADRCCQWLGWGLGRTWTVTANGAGVSLWGDAAFHSALW